MASLDFSWAVKGVDAMLRRRHGIVEYSDAADCMLRYSLARAKRARTLSDGASVVAGAPVVEIHYWNERLPVIPREGSYSGWAAQFAGRLVGSLHLLGEKIERDPKFDGVVAFSGAPAFARGSRNGLQLARICRRIGFDILEPEAATGLGGRLHAFFDGVLVWALVWAFNRAGLKTRGLAHGRHEIWMSRAKFLSLYGARAQGAALTDGPPRFVPFDVTICGIDELGALGDRGVTHILSLLDPGWPTPDAFAEFTGHRRLDLRFHDIIEAAPGWRAPEAEDVERLLAFGRDLAGDCAHLVVHCQMGISRSSAATWLVLAQARPDRSAADILAEIVRIRPYAWPNLRMVELGDAMLNRGGALIEAAHERYRDVIAKRPELRSAMLQMGRAREIDGG